MKSLALTATVVAGLLCSAGTADAQYRYRNRGTVYSYPTYNTPVYSYPRYNSGVVVTSGYTPSIYSGVYNSGYYSTPYYNSGYYNNGYYNNRYYSGYNNNSLYVSPWGVNVGNRRGWRW